MASKTRLRESVRAFRWREVGDALDQAPALIGIRDDRGRNWRHPCCASPLEGDPADSIRTADLLLDCGFGLDEPASSEGKWKATPLWHAIAWSRFGSAEELLEAGADPDHRNPKGETPLHLMLRKGSAIERLRLFARHGARGDIPDARGRTVAEIMRRKRDPAFRALADELKEAGR